MTGEHNKGIWSSSAESSEKQIDTNEQTSVSGELYVKSPSIFVGYYKKEDATDSVFEDGWFKTGDVAAYNGNGIFKILGRNNIDIIKTGGYKVSALDIETLLLEHPQIADVCVVGVPDEIWGQRIAALIVLKGSSNDTNMLTQEQLDKWCEHRIDKHQIPTTIKIMDEIPRNAMGKTNKREILRNHFS